MSTVLPIQGWDYTVSSCSSKFCPVFYVVPDYEWISFLSINGYLHVPVQIRGTGTYDGTHWVKMDKQPETVWYVGFLPMEFRGQPNGIGTVRLHIPEDTIPPPPLSCTVNGCC